ncbi:MAG: tRNA pseudouridine(54/55) synthase Pus10 [Thermoplasmata archaeon]
MKEKETSIFNTNNKQTEYKLCDCCIRLVDDLAIKYKTKVELVLTNTSTECYLCGNLFMEIDKFTKLVLEKLDNYEYATFLIGLKTDDDLKERTRQLWDTLFQGCMYDSDRDNPILEEIRSGIKRQIGKEIEKKTNKTVDFNNPDITAVVDARYDIVELQISPIYIYGRYLKLVRDIPQTKWDCRVCRGKGCERCNGTGKMYPTSVEELIGEKILSLTKGKGTAFHGMGREDIDARMLGNGRPFIIEIVEPTVRTLDLKKIENGINIDLAGKIEVHALKYASKKDVVTIKNAKFDKTYMILVEFENHIDKEKIKEGVKIFKNTEINQHTPLRVKHRRADMCRKRKIIEMELDSVHDKTALLRIRSEGGTYIKELIHGDDGRTQPNLSEILGTKCTVKELDVIKIHDQ